jgi:hypothetical protein
MPQSKYLEQAFASVGGDHAPAEFDKWGAAAWGCRITRRTGCVAGHGRIASGTPSKFRENCLGAFRSRDASCRLAHGFADSIKAQSGRTKTTG